MCVTAISEIDEVHCSPVRTEELGVSVVKENSSSTESSSTRWMQGPHQVPWHLQKAGLLGSGHCLVGLSLLWPSHSEVRVVLWRGDAEKLLGLGCELAHCETPRVAWLLPAGP